MTADVLQLLYRYVDRVDAGDLDAVGALFTSDAVYDIVGTERKGPDEIVRALRSALSHWDRTSHHATNALVETTEDGSTARVSASVYAYHGRDQKVWHFWGRYTQELVRRDNGWAIARMALAGIASDPPSGPGAFTGHPDRRPVMKP